MCEPTSQASILWNIVSMSDLQLQVHVYNNMNISFVMMSQSGSADYWLYSFSELLIGVIFV